MVSLAIRAVSAIGIFGAVSSGVYDYIDSPVGYTDHWVDPEKVTNGAGTFLDPLQFSQMLAFNPAGGRHRFRVLPGTLAVTGVNPDSKMPFLQPTFSGTEANPVIVRCEFSATKASTTSEQLTIIRRTAGQGSIIGTEGPADHWIFDGFKFEGGVRSTGGCEFCGGNENAVIVLRSCVGWQFTRFHVDGEQVDWTEQPSTNGGAIFMQGIDDIVLRDFLIENIGDPVLSTFIWHGVEMYDATDVEISYFTIRNVWGLGIHMKGAPNVQFQRNRIHHGTIDNCRDTGIHPFDVEAGVDPANHNYWWNIIIKNTGSDVGSGSAGHAVQFNVIGGPHRGTHLQNLTLVNSLNSSIMFRPVSYSADISIRNTVMDDAPKHLEFLDAFYPGNGNNLITFNYNRYNTFTNIDESSSGSDSTLAAWRTRSSQDLNSDTTTAQYVNAAGGNYQTATAVAADRPDTHGLYGTVGAMIRPGAWEACVHRSTL